MAGSIKQFNWLRTPSAWQANLAWRERQQVHRADFEAVQDAANASFASASQNLTSGLNEVTAKIALKRVSEETTAKLSRLA